MPTGFPGRLQYIAEVDFSMKKTICTLLVLCLAGCASHKQPTVAANHPTMAMAHVQRVGPASLYPDANMTSGKYDTLSVGDLTKRWTEHCPSGKATCTYSQAHRNVPASVHTKVYDEYNVPQAKRNIANGEVDHLYPLCAGGSNDISNLWYQPITNEWNGQNFGFKEKDRLETYICQEIVANRMNPADAYRELTEDWVKFYMDEGLDHVE
jgi:hypothetical protein